MASVLARSKLARAAERLNEYTAPYLPPLLLMTDDERVPDPLAAARTLPRGAAVILRHRDPAARERAATSLLEMSVSRGIEILIADDAGMALRVKADGVHFPEARIGQLTYWRTRHPDWLITVSAHSERALLQAAGRGADAALLAPLFPTKSHPEKPGFGLARFRMIARRAPLPVYALGGVMAGNAARLCGAHLAGIAAIEGLLPDDAN